MMQAEWTLSLAPDPAVGTAEAATVTALRAAVLEALFDHTGNMAAGPEQQAAEEATEELRRWLVVAVREPLSRRRPATYNAPGVVVTVRPMQTG